MHKLFHLIQFSDSTLPVGTFSFSNGLESACHCGAVHDKATLAQYAASAASQTAFCDAVAALLAFRAATEQDYARIVHIDHHLMLFKLNSEARLMLIRMGKKLAELGIRLYGQDSLFGQWLADIKTGNTPGAYPVAQAIAFALDGQDEKGLYISHQYAVINMILSAALRCLRVSHYETQEILFSMAADVEKDYERARTMNLENMNAYVPEMDIFASLHEKGSMRMFMN